MDKSSIDAPTINIKSIAEPKDTRPIQNIDPEVQLWFEDFLNDVEVTICKQSIKIQKTEIKNLTNELLNRVEFREGIRKLVKDIVDTACDTAPSTIVFNKEREKVRQLKLDKIRNPWKSEKSRVLVGVPKVFSRALRSMLRNGTITKPRARQLALLYSKAPTLEEEDEAAADGNVTERSIHSLVGEAIKLAEEDEPDEDFYGDETEQGQADTRGRTESIRLLRQESELAEAIDMMHEHERHVLLKRKFKLEKEIVTVDNQVEMVDADILHRTAIKNEKEKECRDFMDVIRSEQKIMDTRNTLNGIEKFKKRRFVGASMYWYNSTTKKFRTRPNRS